MRVLPATRFWLCVAVLGVSSVAANATAFEDCFSQDDLDRKVKGCTQFIKDKSTSPEDRAQAYVNRGGVYGRRDECDKAIADYTKAIEIKPDLASAYNNRAYCYLTQDKRDLALAGYNKAIELDPKSAIYYRNRAGFYMEEKAYEPAIADYTKFIDINPKVADVYASRGEAYRENGDAKSAIADYTKAIELDSDNPKTYSDRAALYASQNEQDAAIADYSKAIGMQGEDEITTEYWFRGQAYTDKGEYDLAIADYTKALSLMTEDVADFAPLVIWNRAMAKGLKGDRHAEIADWDEYLKDGPAFDAYYHRGVARYFTGDVDSAEKDILRSLEEKPSLYAASLLFLVRATKGDDGTAELETNLRKIDSKDWPLPATEYLLGKQSEADLLKAATVPWQTCEAKTFIGWLKSVKGDRAAAAETLEQAVAECPKGEPGLGWAKAELARAESSAGGGATGITAKTSGTSQEMELSFWNSVKDSDDPDMLQAYLDKFPDGTFASLAKIKLDKLKEAQ